MEATLAEITITPELWNRPAHPAEIKGETAAIGSLADTMARIRRRPFRHVPNWRWSPAAPILAASACSNVPTRETRSSGGLRWPACKDHLHGTTPRRFSPCGICVDTSEPLLMRRPELFYKYLDVGPPFHEALLIPLFEKGSQLEGTLWIVADDAARKFDGEDARMMQRLSVFTATALRIARVAEEARAAADEKDLLFRELDHRVKNRLQMAAGLLRLQVRRVADPTARGALETTSQRLFAMGLAHRIGSSDADVGEVIRNRLR